MEVKSLENPYILLLILGVILFLYLFLKKPACKHERQVYFDAAGDELPGYDTEACFSKCLDCGQVSVIPSNFQSDAHFDNYLYECEMGGSQAVRKIRTKTTDNTSSHEK